MCFQVFIKATKLKLFENIPFQFLKINFVVLKNDSDLIESISKIWDESNNFFTK